MYEKVNIALQKTDVVKSFAVSMILRSKKEKLLLFSKLKVNLIFLCLELI